MIDRSSPATLIAAAAFVGVFTQASDASACGPMDPGPLDEPCTTLRVWTPAESFPMNLEHTIRVAVESRQGDAVGPADVDIDDITPPIVYTATESGFREVSYELVEEEDLVPNARRLQLVFPTAGRYHVVWADETCKDTPSPTGEGIEVDTFTMTDPAEFPSSLGVAEVEAEEIVTEEVFRGIGGDCGEIWATETVHYTHFAVALDESMSPWAESAETGIEVDGELGRGFWREDPLVDGRFEFSIRHVCEASDDPEPDNRFEPSTHEAVFLARFEDLPTVRSSPVTFDIDCTLDDPTTTDPPPDEMSDPEIDVTPDEPNEDESNESQPTTDESSPDGWTFEETDEVTASDTGCCSTTRSSPRPALLLLLIVSMVLRRRFPSRDSMP